MRAKGSSFIEILIAMAILSLCIAPIYHLFSGLSSTHALSEEQVYAEVFASRILEHYSALPYFELAAISEKENVMEKLIEEDKEDNCFNSLPPYGRKIAQETRSFSSKLTVRELSPGLLCLSAEVSWTPEKRGAHVEGDFSYCLVKFVSRSDLGIIYREREAKL